MKIEAEIDARGLACPLPVLKLRKGLQSLESGAYLKMLADDPAASIDIPHFCNETGHILADQSVEGSHQIYIVQHK